MNKNNELKILFFTFLKIGAFSFGGGYAMIPTIQREIVEKHQFIEEEELLDIIAVSEATPGPIAINSATFIGYRIKGFLGALLSTCAVVLPSFIIIMVLSQLLAKYQYLSWLNWAMDGMRAGIAVLIINAVIKLSRSCPRTNLTSIIMIAAFLGAAFLQIDVIIIIVCAGMVGLIRQLLITRHSSGKGKSTS